MRSERGFQGDSRRGSSVSSKRPRRAVHPPGPVRQSPPDWDRASPGHPRQCLKCFICSRSQPHQLLPLAVPPDEKGRPLRRLLIRVFNERPSGEPACLGARVVQRIRLPCERESVLPPSSRYPVFLRPDREDRAAAGTLKTATDLFVRTLLARIASVRPTSAHYNRCTRGRDIPPRGLQRTLSRYQTKNYCRTVNAKRFALFPCGMAA